MTDLIYLAVIALFFVAGGLYLMQVSDANSLTWCDPCSSRANTDRDVNLAVEAVAATGRGKVEFLVGPKIRHKLLHPCEGCLEGCWHGTTLARN